MIPYRDLYLFYGLEVFPFILLTWATNNLSSSKCDYC
jgi:hypothetical protein